MKKTKKPCKHQWFELKKLVEYPPQAIGPGTILFNFPSRQGVLVACVNCELKKELWEEEKL